MRHGRCVCGYAEAELRRVRHGSQAEAEGIGCASGLRDAVQQDMVMRRWPGQRRSGSHLRVARLHKPDLYLRSGKGPVPLRSDTPVWASEHPVELIKNSPRLLTIFMHSLQGFSSSAQPTRRCVCNRESNLMQLTPWMQKISNLDFHRIQLNTTGQERRLCNKRRRS